MKKKIIILTSLPFTEQLLKDFYYYSLKENFSIQLWSLCSFVMPNYEMPERINCIDILSEQALMDKIITLSSGDIVITNIHLYWFKKYGLLNCFALFKKKNISTIFVDKGCLFNYLLDNSYYKLHEGKIVKCNLLNLFYKRMLNSNFSRTLMNFIRYKNSKFDYFLGEYNYVPSLANEFIHVHHSKYDEYLKVQDEAPIITEAYILFLDTNMAYHPDIISQLNEKQINSKKYFDLMNSFFSYVEEKTNMNVIIALHPSSNYRNDEFNGRKIYKGNTANLINNCEFVLAHSTTSIMNCILANKDILLIYYQELLEKGSKYNVLGMFEYYEHIGCHLLNIEKQFDFELGFNEKLYENFIDKYLVRNDKVEVPNSQLIINFLDSI